MEYYDFVNTFSAPPYLRKLLFTSHLCNYYPSVSRKRRDFGFARAKPLASTKERRTMDKITSKTQAKRAPELYDLIEEVDEAYRTFASKSGSMNTDYAGFACIALDNFREALHAPDLSCDDLQALLRAGLHEHHRSDKDADWTKLVASHIKRTSNQDTEV